MSSQELNNQINYDTSLNLSDSSYNINNIKNNIFDKDNNYNAFIKSVFLNFVGILIWGILGTSCIFWFRKAAFIKVDTNMSNCYVEKNKKDSLPFNFIDLYFPYNTQKLPYTLPQGCENLKTNVPITSSSSDSCDTFSFFNNNSGSNLNLPIAVNFPYNYFSNIDDLKSMLDKNSNNYKQSIVKRFFIFIQLLFVSSIISNITGGRKLVNKFLYLNNTQFKIPSFLIMIFAKIFLMLILFIRFIGSLFTPLFNIFNIMNKNDLFIYLFCITKHGFLKVGI